MKTIGILVIALAAAIQAGSQTKGYEVWTAPQLGSVQAELASKVDAQKFAAQGLGNFGNHSFMLAHREGNGQAEVHEAQKTYSSSRAARPRSWWAAPSPIRRRLRRTRFADRRSTGGIGKRSDPATWCTFRLERRISCWWIPESSLPILWSRST